jgi:hypothetical protein
MRLSNSHTSSLRVALFVLVQVALISPTWAEIIVPSSEFLQECSLYDDNCENDPFIGLFCAWDAYAYCLPKAVTAAYLQQQCITFTSGTEDFCDTIGGYQYFKFAPPLAPSAAFVDACMVHTAACNSTPSVAPFCLFDGDWNCLPKAGTAAYLHQQCISFGTEDFCDNVEGNEYFKFGGASAPTQPPPPSPLPPSPPGGWPGVTLAKKSSDSLVMASMLYGALRMVQLSYDGDVWAMPISDSTNVVINGIVIELEAPSVGWTFNRDLILSSDGTTLAIPGTNNAINMYAFNSTSWQLNERISTTNRDIWVPITMSNRSDVITYMAGIAPTTSSSLQTNTREIHIMMKNSSVWELHQVINVSMEESYTISSDASTLLIFSKEFPMRVYKREFYATGSAYVRHKDIFFYVYGGITNNALSDDGSFFTTANASPFRDKYFPFEEVYVLDLNKARLDAPGWISTLQLTPSLQVNAVTISRDGSFIVIDYHTIKSDVFSLSSSGAWVMSWTIPHPNTDSATWTFFSFMSGNGVSITSFMTDFWSFAIVERYTVLQGPEIISLVEPAIGTHWVLQDQVSVQLVVGIQSMSLSYLGNVWAAGFDDGSDSGTTVVNGESELMGTRVALSANGKVAVYQSPDMPVASSGKGVIKAYSFQNGTWSSTMTGTQAYFRRMDAAHPLYASSSLTLIVFKSYITSTESSRASLFDEKCGFLRGKGCQWTAQGRDFCATDDSWNCKPVDVPLESFDAVCRDSVSCNPWFCDCGLAEPTFLFHRPSGFADYETAEINFMLKQENDFGLKPSMNIGNSDRFVLSPDGTILVIHAGSALRLYRLNSEHDIRTENSVTGNFTHTAPGDLTTDGRWYIFFADDELYVLDVLGAINYNNGTGVFKKLVPSHPYDPNTGRIRSCRVSGDGAFILVTSASPKAGIEIFSRDDSSQTWIPQPLSMEGVLSQANNTEEWFEFSGDSKTIGRYMTNSTHAYYERIVLELRAASLDISRKFNYRIKIAQRLLMAKTDILKQKINDSNHLRVSV